MKRTFQIFCLALAVLGLSNCTAYVDDPGYVTSRSSYGYRSVAPNHYSPYYGNSRYYNSRRVNYSSRYDRDRHHHHRHDSHRGRDTHLNTRVRANVGVPLPFIR